jgi:hypothetical protein
MAQSFFEKRADPKYIANKANMQANWGASLWILGFVFAILGVIADTTATSTLGLTMMAWFMLAIVFHLAGLSFWLGWALALYLKSKKSNPLNSA